jgi:hypothetical protein
MSQITDVEIRWMVGRASKGSPSLPTHLMYRVQRDGVWSEWRPVHKDYSNAAEERSE